MNTIAVLLPVYEKDNSKYFEIAVKSLLAQTKHDFKVFLGVDGPIEGDLDQTVKECESSAKFCVIRFNENRGLACVLNDLIATAEDQGHEFFARMDADDICVSTRFEKQLKFLQAHAKVDVVGGKIEEIDDNGKKNGKAVIYPLTHVECRKFFRYRDPLAHPTAFFRKRYFDKAKSYRSEYRKNQDTILWFDGFMNGCIFANLPDTVLYFRVEKDFYKRRSGYQRAKQMLIDRIKINKALKYDFSAMLYAFAMFFMTISPKCVKKILYRIR